MGFQALAKQTPCICVGFEGLMLDSGVGFGIGVGFIRQMAGELHLTNT